MDDVFSHETLLTKKPEETSNLKVKAYEESKKIWNVALPTMIANATAYGSVVVTQSFVGHTSAINLAGYALVHSFIVRLVTGFLVGMSSATETLCGQAFGGKQYEMMGIFLQRSWLVDLLTLTVLLPVFVFATPIFRLLGQEKAVAQAAGPISLWFILYMYSFVFNSTIQMYLQAQQMNMIVAWLSLMQFVINIPLSWLFVNVLDWGITGAMGALCISSWLSVFGQFAYVVGGWCSGSWNGFTFAAFKDILPVVKLSMSSGIMFCLEFGYYAILVLLAGYMKNGEVSVSAFSICFNIAAWIVMITLGFMGAAIVRVANELGRGDAGAVKFSIKVLISTSVGIGFVFSILILVFGHKLGYAFTNDEQVVQSVSDLTPHLSFTVLICSLYPVLSGVAVGSGLQSKVAVINLICYYVLGLPIGVVIGYVFHLEVKGVWIGFNSGVATQTMALCIMTGKTNWDAEVSKASARLKRWQLKHPKDITESGDHDLS